MLSEYRPEVLARPVQGFAGRVFVPHPDYIAPLFFIESACVNTGCLHVGSLRCWRY